MRRVDYRDLIGGIDHHCRGRGYVPFIDRFRCWHSGPDGARLLSRSRRWPVNAVRNHDTDSCTAA